MSDEWTRTWWAQRVARHLTAAGRSTHELAAAASVSVDAVREVLAGRAHLVARWELRRLEVTLGGSAARPAATSGAAPQARTSSRMNRT